MHFNYRISLLSLLLLIVYTYASYSYIDATYKKRLHEKYNEITFNVKNELQTLIDEKKEAILLLSLALSENNKIKSFLITNKQENFALDIFSTKLKKYSSLHNVWFQIISTEGISLYRSWTKEHGDDLTKMRKDIVQVIKKPQILSTIGIGKFDITFKSIVPLFDNTNKFIGIIETIAKFNSISKKLESKHIQNLLIVDKKYHNQLHFANKENFINGYYIANKSVDQQFTQEITKNLQQYLHIHTYIIKNHRLFTLYKLQNINKKNMAYFILSKDLKYINISDIMNQKFTLISISILIFIFFSSILYYLYFIDYKKFMKQQKKLLEQNVKYKTKQLQEQSRTLKYQAEHDPLTNLPNRLLFLDRLKQALKHAKRKNGRVSVLFFDLDRFKEVNDTYGHEIGDKLLQEVTKRLLENRREEDTIARLGGDEFTLLLINQDEEGILHIVNSIIEKMQKPFYINNLELYTTFSIGISSYPEDGNTYDELLRNADIAMYEAKANGKNKYHFYNTEMTKIAMQRIQLEKELRQALEKNEFIPYFQPKIDAKNNKIIGLESLIRWEHPKKGIIFPDAFIPFAEEIGLIDTIDNHIAKISMQKVLSWKNKGIYCGKLSVNLSTRQLASKNYLQEVQTLLKETNFDTNDLEIEITETHIMSDPDKAMEILNKIRSLGISIAVDDFGTGYSSLSYLKKLPITKLKIDKSFVTDIPKDKDDMIIVKTIISLAKNLNLELIAEGVERKEQIDFLLQEGCDIIQGYYFSKPLNPNECEKFLQKYTKNNLI